MRNITIITALVFAAVLGGCTIRQGDFTVLSNKLFRLSDVELDKAPTKKGAVGEEIQHIIIFFPTSGPPTLEGALDNILRENDGDLVTDAVVSFRSFYIPYIYGQSAWIVEGDVVKTRKN